MQINDTTAKNALQNAKLDAVKNASRVSGFGTFEENLNQANSQIDKNYEKLKKEIEKDAKMFKTFDFQQMMNKLEFGNLKDNEKEELIAKMMKIAKEI